MRDKTDLELGRKVKTRLQMLGLETLVKESQPNQAHEAMVAGIHRFLILMGLDINDPSLKETPERVGSMFVDELCLGLDYANFPKCTTTPNGNVDGATASEVAIGRVNEMVMIDSINTVSLCEHHFQTIHGKTHIAYIPGNKLLGLSKFARVTDFFARRPQVQERMTEQIYAALAYILETPDIAVQQVCAHNCMRSRGMMDPNSMTTTSKMGGKFMDNPSLRQEFLHGIR
jgi:GTP cyclohydrolase I